MPGQVSSSEDEHLDPAAGREGTVLVVDDDAAVRSSMADILRSQGFAAAQAADGAAATWPEGVEAASGEGRPRGGRWDRRLVGGNSG